jgi:hypothetical protein
MDGEADVHRVGAHCVSPGCGAHGKEDGQQDGAASIRTEHYSSLSEMHAPPVLCASDARL